MSIREYDTKQTKNNETNEKKSEIFVCFVIFRLFRILSSGFLISLNYLFQATNKIRQGQEKLKTENCYPREVHYHE
jgi:hypothetical protein